MKSLEDNILLGKQLVSFSVIISLGESSYLSSKNSFFALLIFFFFQPLFVDINTSSNKFLHSYHLLLLYFFI